MVKRDKWDKCIKDAHAHNKKISKPSVSLLRVISSKKEFDINRDEIFSYFLFFVIWVWVCVWTARLLCAFTPNGVVRKNKINNMYRVYHPKLTLIILTECKVTQYYFQITTKKNATTNATLLFIYHEYVSWMCQNRR